jgi:hypothetical protein
MPAVLKQTACPSCGHRHQLSLPAGDLTPGHDYTYVCPATGARSAVRPLAPPEPARDTPPGAVQLSPTAEAVAVGETVPG